MDALQVAAYLEDLARQQFKRDRRGANALQRAAQLLRAGNDNEPTEPVILICPHCGMLIHPAAP